WLARRDERRSVRRLAWAAVGLVFVQAALGGIRVLLVSGGIAENPAWIKVVHAGTAQVFFCVAVALAAVFSPTWRSSRPRALDAPSLSLMRTAAFATVLLFVQALLGALARHGLVPREIHALAALPVL